MFGYYEYIVDLHCEGFDQNYYFDEIEEEKVIKETDESDDAMYDEMAV